MPSGSLKASTARLIKGIFPKLWMERELHFRPNHFEDELWLVPVFCNKHKTAIDVGANMGLYSYLMAKYSKQVIAFEPNTELWPVLRRLMGRNFRLEAAALSDRSAKVIFRVDPTNTGVSTIEGKNQLTCVKDNSVVVSREIEARTLDSFDLPSISMIKIDVEGHEESVVSGARATIDRFRPILIIESEGRHNPGAPHRLAAKFFDLDYLVFYLKGGQPREFGSLRDEDIDPRNLDRGLTYINNFIFIPAEKGSIVKSMQQFCLVKHWKTRQFDYSSSPIGV